MKLSYKVETKFKRLVFNQAKLERTVAYYANELRNEVVDNINAHNLIDTGTLINSNQVQATGLEAEVGTRIHYAIYHELGTSKLKARPFYAPAIAKIEPEFIKAIRKII
jgi:HK97 gp10 family phage protein